jgi:hypothetical protein
VLWAREGAQLLVQVAPEASRHVVITLRAAERAQVDAAYAIALAQGWPVK